MVWDALHFSPYIPWAALIVLGIASASLLAFGAYRRARGMGLRALFVAAMLLTLANPQLVGERQ